VEASCREIRSAVAGWNARVALDSSGEASILTNGRIKEINFCIQRDPSGRGDSRLTGLEKVAVTRIALNALTLTISEIAGGLLPG
jgi:hypothetical protein